MKSHGNEKNRLSGQRYFKETVRLYGVKAADAHKVSKALFPGVKDLPKHEIFEICEQLWQTGYIENAFVACDWSYNLKKQYESSDFDIFEKWVSRYVTNWASCDTLCNHTVGEFIEQFPGFITPLKTWARSDNMWMRRAAAVTFIVPARKGKFPDEIFEIADILLTDKEDLVQKGYGWMLKAASQARPSEVFDYVMKNKVAMPRTALRYAIEKMPADKRKQAMEKL